MKGPADLCRCGLNFDEHRQCAHCDRPGASPCRTECPRCAQRDTRCEVCSAYCGTKAAADNHARNDRKREIDEARRRNEA